MPDQIPDELTRAAARLSVRVTNAELQLVLGQRRPDESQSDAVRRLVLAGIAADRQALQPRAGADQAEALATIGAELRRVRAALTHLERATRDDRELARARYALLATALGIDLAAGDYS